MKQFVLAAILALGLVSCSSCTKPNDVPITTPTATVSVPTPTATPVDTNVTLSKDNFKITVPNANWVALPPTPDQIVGYLNKDKQNLVVLVKEPFSGSYENYILEAIRSVKNDGGTVVSTKQVSISNQNFVLVEATQDMVSIWMWVTVVNEFGYSFSCGGPQSVSDEKDLCSSIADTLQIK